MDIKKADKRKPFPKENAGFFSLLTFSYSLKFIHKGKCKEIEEDDLYDVMNTFQSKRLGDELELKWNDKKPGKKNKRIIETLFSRFGLTVLLLFFGELIAKILYLYFFPKAVSMFVSHFDRNQPQVPKNLALCHIGIIVSLTFLNGLWSEHYQLWKLELGSKIQISVSSLVYRKILRLSENKIYEISTGKIVTIMMKDVLLFCESSLFGIDFVLECFHVLVLCYLLYQNIGVGSSIGVGVIAISLMIQVCIAGIIYANRSRCNKSTDHRIHQTEEVLSFMKFIKMYRWESFFSDRVKELRKIELSYLQSMNVWKSLSMVIGLTSGSITQLSIILFYAYLGNNINADFVFYVQQLLQRVTLNTIYISAGIKAIAGLVVATERIDSILNTEDNDSVSKNSIQIMKSEVIRVGDGILQPGLNILIGQTGSGKSTLLKAIIDQYNDSSNGSISPRKLSYASQTPWLFPSSVKQNILFGEPFDEEKYKNVLSACSLTYDLSALAKGDETILTDGGANLSKGQQMRINLARAIYRDGDIYLLDDCLASLDVRTENYVFNHAIFQLLRTKICLLVTHKPRFLNRAENLIVMGDKVIKHIGKPDDISLELFYDGDDNQGDTLNETEDELKTEEKRLVNDEELSETTILLENNEEDEHEINNIYREKRRTDSVKQNLYLSYLKFGGGIVMAMNLTGLHVICEASNGLAHKFMSIWVNNMVNNASNSTTNLNESFVEVEEEALIEKGINASEKVQDSLGRGRITFSELVELDSFALYITATVMFTVFIVVRYVVSYYYSTKVSKNIHDAMITNILHGSMVFFDTNMIGNILTRFSKDLFFIDELLPFFFVDGIKTIFYLPSCLLLISSVNLKYGLIGVALILTYSFLCYYVRSTTTCLQRIITATSSPIIGRTKTSLEGVTVIRAHGRQQILRDEFESYLDTNYSALHTLWIAVRLFCFWVQTIGSVFILLCTLILLYIDTGTLPGDVGLVIYQSTLLFTLLYHFLLSVVITEYTMTSMERVLEYTDISQETQNGQTLQLWPSEGFIEFQNVSLTYGSNHETILKNLNFKILPHEKIGIVGRTGAGKSSIISVLMRLYDFIGDIKIDNISIKTLSLECLRSHIIIIPQEPVIFIGTIRSNIDPNNNLTDTQIWKALEEVNLTSFFNSLDEDLKNKKLSEGQKQLICLARAVTKKSKILILDEATADMDDEMDLFVQNKIEELFQFCTVLMIAHKLHTVMRCDKIIVVDKGEIVEYDTPHKLLQNSNSLFFKMINHNVGIKTKLTED